MKHQVPPPLLAALNATLGAKVAQWRRQRRAGAAKGEGDEGAAAAAGGVDADDDWHAGFSKQVR